MHLGASAAAALGAPAVFAQTSSRAAAASASLTPIKFTLDYRITGQIAPFFVALYKGYYEQEGVSPVFDVGSGSVASITRIASGAYDMGSGDVSSLIELHAAQPGAPSVQAVYQYYNRAPFVIIGRKDRGVTTDFKSLRGKRIAAAAVESTRRVWPMAARQSGVAVDAFEWITTDFSQRDNVIVRGDVDGATYFHDSALSLFERIDPSQLSVLSYADVGVALYGNAFLASTKMIAENPKAIAGFLRATNRGLMETLANPLAAMAFVKQREGLIDEKLEARRFEITAAYLTAADTRTHGVGAVRAELVQQQVDQVSEIFGLKTKPDASQIYNLSFMPPLAERMVKRA
ncbi:ABC transporter substrate-binding protein [soil metagenome]